MKTQTKSALLKFDLCQSIIDLNENTLVAALVDENGKIKEMKVRDNSLFNNLSPSRRTTMFDDLVLCHMRRKEFDDDIGKEEYTLTKRIRMNLISFPIRDSLLIVTTQPFIDTYHICKKILKTIKESES